MTDLEYLNEILTKHEAEFYKLRSDTTDYIKGLKNITVSYIDSSLKTCDSPAHCYSFIARLYEASRSDIPGKLSFLITSLFSLKENAALKLSCSEMISITIKAEAVIKKVLNFTEGLNRLQDVIIPEHLKRLLEAVESGKAKVYESEIPFAIIATLNALIDVL